MFYAYTITNNLSGKFYIGITNNVKTRTNKHIQISESGKEKYPKHFQAIHYAIKKYGVENFTFETIKIFDNEDEAYFYEEDIIIYCKLNNIKMYNIAGGGKGTGSGINHPTFGKKLSKEWVDNMSKAAKNNMSEAKREKRRQQLIQRNWIGENHPMFGKKHSEETRKKISDAAKQNPKIVSLETRQKISAANKGKEVSNETRLKLSEAIKKLNMCGEKNPNYGNKWSDEQKQHLSDLKTGKPNHTSRKLSIDQVREILQLIENKIPKRKIARDLGVNRDSINQILKGKSYIDMVQQIKKENKNE